MIHALLERCGAEQVRGFGRLLIDNLQKRSQAAKAAGVTGPTFILCDHEFAAVVFFLSKDMYCVHLESDDNGIPFITKEGKDPLGYTQSVCHLGYLMLADATIVSEGRAMAQMREQAEKNAAGKMGFN